MHMPLVAGWGIECKKSCAFPLPLNKLRGPSYIEWWWRCRNSKMTILYGKAGALSGMVQVVMDYVTGNTLSFFGISTYKR